jgi:hypothetical protein
MLARIAAFLVLLCGAVLADVAPVPLADAVAAKQIRAEFSGNGRDVATLKLVHTGGGAVNVLVPAGTVLGAANGEKQITLRALRAEIAAGGEAEAVLPTAALSSKNTSTQRTLTPAAHGEPRLAKLLEFFDKQNDLPRATGQLAIFVLLEDITWAGWQQWLAPVWALEKPAKPHPTPAEVAQAVDALAFVKLAASEKAPAFLKDEDFKRLALRNPWARGKAMVLYGLSVEDAITGDPSLPPDLGKLLHTAPNDNCPICRQRGQMQKGNEF